MAPEIANHPEFIKMKDALEAAKIVIEQQADISRRKWPNGRLSGQDDGQLAFAIAGDSKNEQVSIEFGKPVTWFSMTPQNAIDMAAKLIEVAMKISAEPLDVNLLSRSTSSPTVKQSGS